MAGSLREMFDAAVHYLEVNCDGAFSPADVPAAALQRPWAIERKEALRLQ